MVPVSRGVLSDWAYASRILNGEAGRPISAGTNEHELVINLKTAKALGLDVR